MAQKKRSEWTDRRVTKLKGEALRLIGEMIPEIVEALLTDEGKPPRSKARLRQKLLKWHQGKSRALPPLARFVEAEIRILERQGMILQPGGTAESIRKGRRVNIIGPDGAYLKSAQTKKREEFFRPEMDGTPLSTNERFVSNSKETVRGFRLLAYMMRRAKAHGYGEVSEGSLKPTISRVLKKLDLERKSTRKTS